MQYATYLDKVRACWLGKNIGGTLGAPFESYRVALDLEYYTHDLSKGVLPNDDLDLQLVWLNAAERHGTKVDGEILSNYWLKGITAYWSEYGAGMNNLENGILPPASGAYKNVFAESCGAFIRSEIWACLNPGQPQLAVKYAYEDACIDHTGEGIYAALFCAAVQSAAFAETDRDTLIDIGLSYIPADCQVANAIAIARAAFAEGVDWKEARKRILQAVPGTFGLRYSPQEEGIPQGKLGFDAPSNIGLTVMAWLFGENDFSKSVCIAAGAGEDADCTAGTLAAIFGIMHGTKGIDEKWLLPIGDEIKTVAITRASLSLKIPETVSQLTERVVGLMPVFMQGNLRISQEGVMEILPAEKLQKQPWQSGWIEKSDPFWYMYRKDLLLKKHHDLLDVFVMAEDPEIAENTEKQLRFRIINRSGRHLWANLTLRLPAGWGENTKLEYAWFLNEYASGSAIAEKTISVPVGALPRGQYTVEGVLSVKGFPSKIHIPMTFIKAE